MERIATTLLAAFIGLGFAGERTAVDSVDPTISVPARPIAVRGDDGRVHLSYELHVTDFDPNELRISRIEVLDGAGQNIGEFDEGALQGILHAFEIDYDRSLHYDSLGRAHAFHYAGGRGAVAYLWITVSDYSDVPARIEHRLTFSGPGGEETPEATIVTGGGMDVGVGHLAVLGGPPLRGGDWLAGQGPGMTPSAHRLSLIRLDGRLSIAARFAIDYVRLDEDGRRHTRDGDRNEDYHGYGADVLAIDDGVVAFATDGIPENTPGGARAVPLEIGTLGGNSVVLDIGAGLYAHYGHLQPGLDVKPGDHVRQGDVIGRLGNSGNSNEPHLHFQVSDSRSPYAVVGEGLPYVHRDFWWIGRCSDGTPVECERSGEDRKNNAIPLQNSVIRFPDQPPR
ncbi:MAG: M23 family metallopeptidase [Gemmatimonadota bacterium]